MAMETQLQEVIDLLKQQMSVVTTLQAENTALRAAQVNVTPGPTTGTSQSKSKKPGRSIINVGINDRKSTVFG